MNRTLLGAFLALLLAAIGVFWWQGRAVISPGPLPPLPTAAPTTLPLSEPGAMRGPDLPQATEQTREQRRFDRLDRDRDGRISRVEMLLPRVAAFRKLDADGNNLLTFEEWAGVTVSRFRTADRDSNDWLSRIEFATTRPKPVAQPACVCSGKSRRQPSQRPKPDADAALDEGGEPAG